MNALEILKLCQAVDDLNTRPIIKDIQNAVIEVMSLEQRNAELEQRVKELEEPKSCDGCEYYSDFYKSGCATYHPCIRKSSDHFKPNDTK